MVLVHDDKVKLHKRAISIRQVGLAELQDGLDGLLTLDEVIEMVRGKASLMVDMKSPGYEQPVAAAIVRAGIAHETIVSSTYAWSLRAVRKHAPGVMTGMSDGARRWIECAMN